MRLLVVYVSALCTACLGATCAIAQSGQWGQAEDQIPPYLTHIDRRYGHDHSYPDRGAVVRDLPQGATAVHYAGISYQFAGGVWYERHGPAYIVVAPPIGLVVPQLPAFATTLDSGGKSYLYANDVFYRPRPDLGGYEVVNDPHDTVAAGSQAPTHSASSPARRTRQAMAGPPLSETAERPTRSSVQASNGAMPPTGPAAAPSSLSSRPLNPTGVAIRPRNGQSADQQALDRYECYRTAVAQSGFDPLATSSGLPPSEVARRDLAYSRAQAACLEGRGYTLP